MTEHATSVTSRPVPPYPSVILGAGRWLMVIQTLRRTGTKANAAVADNIEKQIYGY